MRRRAQSHSRWWVVAGLVGSAYIAIGLALPVIDVSSFVRNYILQPLMWYLIALVILVLPGYRTSAKSRTRSTLRWLALGIGLVQVAIYVFGGLFFGFGRSSNSFTAWGIVTNLVLVGSMLVGMELSRAWLVNQGGKHAFLALALVSLLYAVITIPLAQIRGMQANTSTITFVGEVALPALAESILASVLAWEAGPSASLAYRGPLLVFWWFCPIIPDLPWTQVALTGVGVPAAGLALATWFMFPQGRQHPRRRGRQRGFPVAWVGTSVVAVFIVWFAVGLFPVEPRLISSGSMEPAIDTGDIAITAEVPTDTIRTGDVISYRAGRKTVVVHRVVEIKRQGEKTSFITKGDANAKPDSEPVTPENVLGKVVLVAPKIGWVGIAVKSLFAG